MADFGLEKKKKPLPKIKYVNEVFAGASFELKMAPVPRRGILHLAPGQREDGYGSKIQTDYMLRVNSKWHRVYCICWSNAGSLYIKSGKDGTYYLSDGFFSDLRDRMNRKVS